MKLRLQEGRKYEIEELEKIINGEVELRIDARGVGRKGEFDCSGIGNDGAEILPAELQAKADHIYLASKLLNRDPRSLKMWEPFNRARTKAMDTLTDGEGGAWVPTGFSNDFIEKIRLERRVAALHRWIAMPTNPYKYPLEAGDIDIFLMPESTSDTATKVTASTPGTDKITFDAAKFAGRALVSKEAEEDSIVPILSHLMGKFAKGIADAVENCTINGDDSGTHQDSDITDAADQLKAFKGYRKIALAAGLATENLATFDKTNLRKIRTAMGEYGMDPTKLAWVPGIASYHKMLSLDEVLTVDKLGPLATLLTGQLAAFDGIAVIPSAKVRENVNASGVFDGITETKTTIALVYKPGFLYGEKRKVSIQVSRDLYMETDQDVVFASQRIDLQPAYDTSTEPIVGLGYNIAA